MTDSNQQQTEINDAIRARFSELPSPVQKAITSADVEKRLRELADIKKLHLDQWQLLENNVMLTLLGFQPTSELSKNLQEDLDVSADRAADLAADISRIVFEPIRQELERELEHPEAKEKQVSGVEAAGASILRDETPNGTSDQASSFQVPASSGEPASSNQLPASRESAGAISESSKLTADSYPKPATPPAPPPTERAVRAPTSSTYKSGEPSTTRKDVHNDPYREAPQ